MLSFLPQSYKTLITHEYYLRVATVIFVAFILLAIIAGVLLIPYIMFVNSQETTATARLASFATSSQAKDTQTFRAVLNTLHAQATRLAPTQTTMPYEIVTELNGVVTSGIAISSINYGLNPDGSASLSLEGIASTRNSLQAFVAALQNAPGLTNVTVPVSDFAQDTNISFSISMTAPYETSH